MQHVFKEDRSAFWGNILSFPMGNHQDNPFWPLCYLLLLYTVSSAATGNICLRQYQSAVLSSVRHAARSFPYPLPTYILSIQSFLGLHLTSPIRCAVRGYKGIKWGVDTSLAQRRPNRSKSQSMWLLANPCTENSFLVIFLLAPHCHWPILREF